MSLLIELNNLSVFTGLASHHNMPCDAFPDFFHYLDSPEGGFSTLTNEPLADRFKSKQSPKQKYVLPDGSMGSPSTKFYENTYVPHTTHPFRVTEPLHAPTANTKTAPLPPSPPPNRIYPIPPSAFQPDPTNFSSTANTALDLLWIPVPGPHLHVKLISANAAAYMPLPGEPDPRTAEAEFFF